MAKSRKKAAKKVAVNKASTPKRPQAGRSMWKGMLGFGLVQVPVSVHSAAVRDDLPFRQLDSKDLSPIGYKRVNKGTGEEVAWGDIVRGYEVSKGEYVVLTDEELAKANVEATRSIDITAFVDASSIPVAYYETPYYLAPEKRAMKAYAVLREAMARAGKIALGSVMLRQREHLCAVVPTPGPPCGRRRNSASAFEAEGVSRGVMITTFNHWKFSRGVMITTFNHWKSLASCG